VIQNGAVINAAESIRLGVDKRILMLVLAAVWNYTGSLIRRIWQL
jgi:hypothetical protein